MATELIPKEKTLPHNAEAERTVLGAVLVDNAAFNSAAEILTRDDFYREAPPPDLRRHGRAGRAQASPSTSSPLKDELVRASALEAVGGAAYLASLMDGMPRIVNVEPWSRIIKEKAALRNLIHASNRIVQSCYEAEDEPAVILDRAEKAIFDIAEHRIRQGFVGIREIVKESFRTIDQLSQSKELVTGLPTGFVDLDERTSGLQKGDLIIVAARPAMGKTSFCLNVAQYASATHRGDGGDLLAGDGQGAARPAHALRGRARGRPPAAHRQPAGEGLGPAGQGLRRPVRLQDLHRRLGLAHAAGDAGQVPPPEGRARPGPGGRRLPAARLRRRAGPRTASRRSRRSAAR